MGIHRSPMDAGLVMRRFGVLLEQNVAQTVDVPVTWDAMSPMWRHWDETLGYSQLNRNLNRYDISDAKFATNYYGNLHCITKNSCIQVMDIWHWKSFTDWACLYEWHENSFTSWVPRINKWFVCIYICVIHWSNHFCEWQSDIFSVTKL